MGVRCVIGDFVERCDLLRRGSGSVTEALFARAASLPQSAGSTLEPHHEFPEFGRTVAGKIILRATVRTGTGAAK